MTRITQETLLAMELNRSHIGKLVQMITESWSLTGTLTRVDQHDNREWEIIYPERHLVPSGGEIYAELWIGPWRGQVIGNQPVTVETVKGTLEAPERPVKLARVMRDIYPPEAPAIEGVVVDALSTLHDVHRLGADPRFTVCGLRLEAGKGWIPDALKYSLEAGPVTCRECKRRETLVWPGPDDLPPEPPAEWTKR